MSGDFEFRPAKLGIGEQALDLRRVSDACGIAQGDPLDAHLHKTASQLEHAGWLDVPFERTSEGGGQRGIDSDDATRSPYDILELRQRLFAVHSQICEIMALARGHDQVDFVDLARERP